MAQLKITRAEIIDDTVVVTGTVDGVEKTISVWKSHLDTLPTKAATVVYVAAQFNAATSPPPTTIDLSATVNI